MQDKDYKDTLNLPATDFPMKANLPEREPRMLQFWQEGRIYEKLLEQNKANTPYVLHDGPPYANGHIHMGHALNKILKDMVVKYNAMQGRYAPYVPGWDCHGLPIELQVDKELGKDKENVTVADKRLRCRAYAQKFIDIQREEFKRLGVLGDWDRPYITMSYGYEARILREFHEFLTRGYAYKGKKPVHWCPSCVTALAEAEVEYADKQSPSVFVKFRIEKPELLGAEYAKQSLSIVIWTTTPWTLPANLGLAINKDIEYALVKQEGEYLIVAEALVEKLKASGILSPESVKTSEVTGQSLTALKALHPFISSDKQGGLRPIFPTGFVSTEDGTGVVHIAPGHGQEDYEAGLKQGLEIYAPVDDHGKFFRTGIAEIDGQFVFKANETIIEMLKAKNALLGQDAITHSYPHCWRCKKPVIFRATEQWFISMAHEGLRDKSLEEVAKVQWVPSWGRERIYGMIKGRPDWCISRQRAWGVPLAVLVCKGCGSLVKDKEVLDRTVAAFEQGGADVWFTRPESDFLGAGYKCAECGGTEFKKETDILDVWFDSGVSHAATLIKERGLSWPADLYLEGSDQHRGWFQSSMLASVGTRGEAPYRTVLTHGYVVDGKGKKMSKSLGNVVAPQDIIKKTGAEILRLWVSAEDYRDDIRISNEIMARLTEAYRKIRNTSKYMLGNLSDFDGKDHSAHMLEIDRWAISRLEGLTERVTEAYEKFNFHEVYHRIHNFCVVDMSSFYLDILKDRLYTYRKDSPERRAAQWVLNEILHTMTRLMAPVLSFTAEEVWGYMKLEGKSESVLLAGFPKAREKYRDPELEARWQKLIAVRDEVNKALELKRAERFLGNALEASLTLHVSDEGLASLLAPYEKDFPMLFIVSTGRLVKGSEAGERKADSVPGLSITVERAGGGKCSRCWNYKAEVVPEQEGKELCGRCREAIG